MFEKAVAIVLQKVLGQFIDGIDAESLKLSVWKGDIALSDLQLNAEAISALGLPVEVVGGTVGEVRVEVPWKHLSTKPITISVRKLYLLIAPKNTTRWDRKAEEQRVLKAKREQLALWETMEREKGVLEGMGERMANQLVQALLRKVVVRVTNVHVRLQTGSGDSTVVAGATLRDLSITAASPEGDGLCSTGTNARVRKTVAVKGLAVYISPGAKCSASPHSDAEWDALMLPMLQATRAPSHLLQPLSVVVNAWLNTNAKDWTSPQVELNVQLPHPVWLSVQQAQFVGLMSLADELGRAERVTRLRLFGRPEATPSSVGARAWWAYAVKATMVLHTSGVHLSWKQLLERRQQRLEYINCYIERLDAKGARQKELSERISTLDDLLEVDDILLYRSIARARVKRLAAHSEDKKKFRWPWEHPESGSAPLSDAEVQQLQAELDMSTGVVSASHCPRGYVQMAVTVQLGGLGLLLSSAPDEPITQIIVRSVSVNFTTRPAEAGMGLQIGVQALQMTDFETPWPQLRTLVWPRQQAEEAEQASKSHLLTFSLEVEPLTLPAALAMNCELRPLSLVVNPRMIASILRYFKVAPGAMNLGVELARRALADTLEQLQHEAANRLRGRALSIRLLAHAPSLLIVEPPPEPSAEKAAAWRAYERDQPWLGHDFDASEYEQLVFTPLELSEYHAGEPLTFTRSTAVEEKRPKDVVPKPKISAEKKHKTAAELVTLGHALNQREEFLQAFECFEAAHAIEPRPSTLISAGNMALKGGRASVAVQIYLSLLKDEATFQYEGGAAHKELVRRKLEEAKAAASVSAAEAAGDVNGNEGAVDADGSADGAKDHAPAAEAQPEAMVSASSAASALLPTPRIDVNLSLAPNRASPEPAPDLRLALLLLHLGSLRVQDDMVAPPSPSGGSSSGSTPTPAETVLMAFTLSLSGVTAALMRPTHVGEMLRWRGDQTGSVDPRDQLVAPIDAALTIRQQLDSVTDGAARRRVVPALHMELDISALRVSATEAQLLAATRLTLSVLGCILPALDNKAVRSGFLACYTTSSFAGRTQVESLGPCSVELQRNWLVYTRRGGVGGVCNIDLSRHKLTQGSATSFALSTVYPTGAGLDIRWSLQLETSSPSETVQWMSAIGEMQAYLSLSNEREATQISDIEQGRMALTVRLPEISIALFADTTSPRRGGEGMLVLTASGAAPSPEPPAAPAQSLACLALSGLEVRMGVSDEELKLHLHVEDVALNVAAAPMDSTPDVVPNVLVLAGDDRGDARGFLELEVACVVPGSPGFDDASAMAALKVAIRPLSLSLTPQVLRNIGDVAMRLGPQLEKAAHDNSVDVSSSMQQALDALGDAAPDAAERAELLNRWAIDPTEPPPEGKAIFSLALVLSRLSLVLQEDVVFHEGEEEASAPPPLASAHFDGTNCMFTVRPTTFELQATVDGVVLFVDPASAAPIPLVKMMPSPNLARPEDDETLAGWSQERHEASLLQLRILGLGAATGPRDEADDPKHEQEVWLTVQPIRVLLLVSQLQRLHAWLESGLETFQDQAAAAAEEVMAAAGQAAVEAGQAVLEQPPPIKLSIRLLGPLLVLPSPMSMYDFSVKAAVVLRVGDLLLTSSIVRADQDVGGVVARLKVALTNTQLLIAWRGHGIDENWMLRPDYQPHWLLPGLHLSLVVDQPFNQNAGKQTIPVSKTDAESAEASLARLHVKLRLSSEGRAHTTPIQLEIAYREMEFVNNLAAELLPLIAEATAPDASANRGSEISRPSLSLVSDEEAVGVVGGEEPGATPSAEAKSGLLMEPTSVERVGMKLNVNLEVDGITLRLLDDSQLNSLPLYELSLIRLTTKGELLIGSTDSGKGEGVHDVTAEVAFDVAARHFNPRNGAWEPIVEEWGVQAQLILSGPEQIELAVITQTLELNIAHAQLQTLLETSALIVALAKPWIQSTSAGTDACRSRSRKSIRADSTKRDALGTSHEVCFRNAAIFNQTECPVQLKLPGSDSAVLVQPGNEFNFDVKGRGTGTDVAPLAVLNAEQATLGRTSDGKDAAPEGPSADGGGGGVRVPPPPLVERVVATTTFNSDLVYSAKSNNIIMASELLRRQANPNSVDFKGRTALHRAAKYTNNAILKLLLEADANIEEPTLDAEQMRPLHVATIAGNLEGVRLLLDYGADPAAPNGQGVTAANLALDLNQDMRKLLFGALKESVVNSNRRFPSVELVEAAACGKREYVAIALKAKADPDSTDGQLTALQHACIGGHTEIAMALIEKGVSINMPAPGADQNGMTALHFAAKAGPLSLVSMLLGCNANPAQGGNDGLLPIDMGTGMFCRDRPAIRTLLREQMEPHVLAEGWLTKLGTERKVFRRRYCLLLPEQIRFYADADLVYHKGEIKLNGLQVSTPSSYPSVPSSLSFDLRTLDATAVLCADDARSLQLWLNSLATVSRTSQASYMGKMRGVNMSEELAEEAEGESPQTDHARSLVTLTVSSLSGIDSQPLSISMAKLGTSLRLLQEIAPNDSVEADPQASSQTPLLVNFPSAVPKKVLRELGVVCQVARERGQRVLFLKSPVEVINDTQTQIQLSMQHNPELQMKPLGLEPGAAYPLPLQLTSAGSEEACKRMLVRPTQDIGRHFDWGTLMQMAMSHLLFMCPSTTPGGPMWMFCAEIIPKTLGAEVSETQSGDGSERFERRRRKEELRLFKLPATETLQHCWGCCLHGSAVPSPGWLFLTPNFICFLSKLTGHKETIKLESIDLLVRGSSLIAVRAQNCIEFVMQGGKRLTFGQFRSRSKTLAALRAARLQSEYEIKSGLKMWKPLTVRLCAPIVISSLLPCRLRLSLQQESSGNGEYVPMDANFLETIHLEQLSTIEVHTIHALSPIRIHLWIGDGDYETAQLHGHINRLERAKRENYSEENQGESTQIVTLHPPHHPLSSLNVRLKVHLNSVEGGALHISIASDHWFINNSILPLDVHEGSAVGGTVLYARTVGFAHPFSLNTDFMLARVCIPASTPVAAGSSGPTGEHAKLSKSFSVAAVGNDMPLEVANGEGVAELAIRISPATGNAKNADRATVVNVHDRITLQNMTRMTLEWRQKTIKDVFHVLPVGEQTSALHWDRATAPRLLHVRPTGSAYEWCAPFSPENIGEMTLKLRRRALDDYEVMYLRCTISMQGCRRHVTIGMAHESKALSLPYQISNDSNMLIAIKQQGSAVWDLLGCGESFGYVLDYPDGKRSLQLYSRDPAGRWQVLSGPTGLDVFGPCAPILGSSNAERPWERVPHGALRPLDTVLFSRACKMRYGSVATAIADGWLIVTDDRITFTPFESSELNAVIGDTGPADHATSATRPMPISEWFGQAGWLEPKDMPVSLLAVEVSDGARHSDLRLRVSIGLRWKDVGSSRPLGSEIVNQSLSNALRTKNAFTWAEFQSFGVEQLSASSFVQVGTSYFKPSAATSASQLMHGQIVIFRALRDRDAVRQRIFDAQRALLGVQEAKKVRLQVLQRTVDRAVRAAKDSDIDLHKPASGMLDVSCRSDAEPRQVNALHEAGLANGIVGWYDSTQYMGENGLAVDEWQDGSGCNRHLLRRGSDQPRYVSFGINGMPSISFGKGDVLVASSGCTVKTVAMVVQFRTMCDRMMLFSQFKDGADQDYALRVWKFGINRNAIRNGLNQNDWCHHGGVTSSDNGKCWVNGDNHKGKWDGFPDSPVVIVAVRSSSRSTSIDADNFVFQLSSRFQPKEGDNRAFDGLIGEVIVWDQELSRSDARKAYLYLHTKWLSAENEAPHANLLSARHGAVKDDDAWQQQQLPSAHLVEVYEFWDSESKQYTFHPGGPWKECEHLNGLQFYAFSTSVPGSIPIFSYWNRKTRKWSFHPEPAFPNEERKKLQFYVHAEQVPGSCAVTVFWNEHIKQHTCHTGEAWEDEEPTSTVFYAFGSRKCARFAELSPQERTEKSITRLQSAVRAASVRRKVTGLSHVKEHREVVNALLCRPNYAMPISTSAEAVTSSVSFVEAVRLGKDNTFLLQLLHQRADPDSFNVDGMAALHVACARNRLDSLRLLLAAGADIELATRDARRNRPLHIAALSGYGVGREGVLLLLKSGADPTAENAMRMSAVALLPVGSRLKAPLLKAAETWKGDDEDTALVERPALVHAVVAGRTARVRFLLVRRTHPDSADEHGASGTHLACARDDARMLSLLLSRGASVNKAANNDVGARPLHCAAIVGSVACIKLLLEKGADPSLSDRTQRLPRERCGTLGQQSRALLLSAAANTAAALSSEPPNVPVNLEPLGPVRELRIGKPKEKEIAETTSKVIIHCTIAGIGVAIIDEEPCEVLYTFLQGLKLGFVQEKHSQQVEVKLAQLQVDNALEDTTLPVALAVAGNNDGDEGDDEPECLHVAIQRNLNFSTETLLYLDYFRVLLHTLQLQLEQNLVARMLRFFDTLTKKFETVQSSADFGAVVEASLTMVEDAKKEMPLELRFVECTLHPVSIRCTVQMAALCSTSALQEYHPTKQLAGVAQRLVSLSNSHLQLKALSLKDYPFQSVDSFVERIIWHYTMQILQGVYKLIGSLDLIGNPLGLFNDVSGGVQLFFYEPRKGLVKSPEAFAYGVARGTKGLTGSIFGGAAGFASALTRNVGMAADALVYDHTYHYQQKVRQQTQVETARKGMSVGLQALEAGVREGAKGVIYQPIQGAMDQGAFGLVKGIGHGLLGVVAKPLSGVATLASKTSEGMASEARRMVMSEDKAFQMRVRQPRALGADGNEVLLPYPRAPLLISVESPAVPKVSGGASSSSQHSQQRK